MLEPGLMDDQLELTLELLAAMIEALERAGINYAFYGGTPIGSYQHHRLIQRDDNLDVLVDVRQRAKILQSSPNPSKFGILCKQGIGCIRPSL